MQRQKETRVGYKVVTPEMKSLGLRRNPNVLTYPATGELYRLFASQIKPGKDDWGGIWVTRRLSKAKEIVRYMAEMHGVIGCRIFVAELGKILYENDYRIKTDSVEFLAEVILD